MEINNGVTGQELRVYNVTGDNTHAHTNFAQK